MRSIEIRGKTALVTGAALRVGRVISLRLAETGINVIITYRSSAREAEETVRELQNRGVKAAALQVDLTDLDACRTLVEEAEGRFDGVDILVNNASLFPRTDLKQMVQEPQEFKKQFDRLSRLHMAAPFYLGLRLGLRMKERGWGRIINITDRVTLKGQAYPNWSLYLATKYGLYGVTQVLAVELSPQVTVNSVAPGLVLPPAEMSRAQVEALRDKIPLKKEAGPEAIAADILYLIQSDSKTGAVILTDGGSSLVTF